MWGTRELKNASCELRKNRGHTIIGSTDMSHTKQTSTRNEKVSFSCAYAYFALISCRFPHDYSYAYAYACAYRTSGNQA